MLTCHTLLHQLWLIVRRRASCNQMKARAHLHELDRDVAGPFVVPQSIQVQPVDLATTVHMITVLLQQRAGCRRGRHGWMAQACKRQSQYSNAWAWLQQLHPVSMTRGRGT